jgi:hypothetical protein
VDYDKSFLGGTVDMVVHKVTPDRRVEEIFHSTGVCTGGDAIDRGLFNLMDKVFGLAVMQRFREEYRPDWLQMRIHFERVKRSVDPSIPQQNFVLPVTQSFAQCCQKVFEGKGVAEVVAMRHKNKGIAVVGSYLQFSYETVKELFNPVVDRVIQHIESLLTKDSLKLVNKCLLVGGFGESYVLHAALKKAFNARLTIIVPNEAGQCVVKGAVLYGHTPSSIAMRRARMTYGLQVCESLNPMIHNPAKTTKKDGELVAFPLFHTIVMKGEEIKSGEQRKFTFKPCSSKISKILAPIYATENLSPEYTDEEGIHTVGMITMDLPGEGMHRDIQCSLTLGSTEMVVETCHNNGKPVSVSVDFLTETVS